MDEKRLLTLLDLGKVLESKDFEQIWQAQQMVQQNVREVKKQENKKEPKQEKSEINSSENLNKKTDLEPETSQLTDEDKTPANIEIKDDNKLNKNQSTHKTITKSKKDKK